MNSLNSRIFRLPVTWKLLGLTILVVGFAGAAWIWHTQGRQQQDTDLFSLPGVLSPEDSAKYQRDVEIYYGKVGLLTEKWTRAAAQLTHGKPLAELVGVLAVLGAAGCFAVSAILKTLGQATNRPALPAKDSQRSGSL